MFYECIFYYKEYDKAYKGTFNYLAKSKKNIESDSQFFLNFLYNIRGILQEININSPCSLPPGVSQTWWNLTIGLYGKHLTFLDNREGAKK